MTAKRKRRRPGSPAGPEEPTSRGSPSRAEDATEQRKGGTPGRRGLGSIPSPYPPFVESVAAGLRAAGSTPGVLIVAFLGELLMWGFFRLLEAPTPAGALAGLMGLPPVHLVFEIPVARSLASGVAQVSVLLAVVAVRAVLLGLLCLQLVEALRGNGDGFRGVLRRLPRVWAATAQFYVIEVAVVLAAPLILGLLGPQFVGIGTIVIMIVGLHFLIMAPVAIAAEDAPAPLAVRWSFRAARLPGLRHFGLVLTYFFLAFSVLIPASGFGLQPATPGVLVWAFALFVTFLHVGVLGAFTYRWLAVREEPAIRSAEARGRRGAGPSSRRVGSSSGNGAPEGASTTDQAPSSAAAASGSRSRRSSRKKRKRKGRR